MGRTAHTFGLKHALCWLVFLVYLGFYFTVYCQQSHYVPLEVAATFYDIWAVQFGISHMPFYAIIRPGFIYNTPLMMAGLSPLMIIQAYLLLVLLSSSTFLYGLDKSVIKRPVFPLLLMLVTPVLARAMDYETAPMVCLAFAWGLLLMDRRSPSGWKWLLCVLFLVAGSFANLGTLPAMLAIIVLIGIAYPCRRSYVLCVTALLGIVLVYAWYYGIEGQMMRMILHSSRLKHHDGLGTLLVKFIYFMVFVMSIVIGSAIAYVLNDIGWLKRKCFAQTVVLICLALVLVTFLLGYIGPSDENIWLNGFAFIWLTLGIVALHRLSSSAFSRDIVVAIIALCLLCVCHRVGSFQPHTVSLFYLPSLLMLLGLVLVRHPVSWFSSSAVALVAVIAIALLVRMMIFWTFSFSEEKGNLSGFWINQYPSYFGKKTTGTMSHIIQQADQAYIDFDCQDKSLLVLGSPGMYFNFRRLAPFNRPWISRENIIPNDAMLTDTVLSLWLAHQSGWCVIDSNTMPIRRWPNRENYLTVFRPFMEQRAKQSRYLGYDWTTWKNYRIYTG